MGLAIIRFFCFKSRVVFIRVMVIDATPLGLKNNLLKLNQDIMRLPKEQ